MDYSNYAKVVNYF